MKFDFDVTWRLSVIGSIRWGQANLASSILQVPGPAPRASHVHRDADRDEQLSVRKALFCIALAASSELRAHYDIISEIETYRSKMRQVVVPCAKRWPLLSVRLPSAVPMRRPLLG
jgi:hypothetical protein